MPTCNMTLANIDRVDACANNQSGVKMLLICPLSDVTAILADKASTITSPDDLVRLVVPSSGKSITHPSGKGFVKVFCADDMGELVYAEQGTIIGCKSLQATLTIFNPGFHANSLGVFAYLINQECIVIAKMNNGEYHMLGDLDRGVKMSDGSSATSGKAGDSENGQTYELKYSCAAPSIFPDAWKPEDTNGGITIISASAE